MLHIYNTRSFVILDRPTRGRTNMGHAVIRTGYKRVTICPMSPIPLGGALSHPDITRRLNNIEVSMGVASLMVGSTT